MSIMVEARILWKWVRDWCHFGPKYLIRNEDVVWEDNDGTVQSVEVWPRKKKFQILRPRYYGMLRNLECGCSQRRVTRRFVLYKSNCETHGLPALRRERDQA
jgi:hypothetical protein